MKPHIALWLGLATALIAGGLYGTMGARAAADAPARIAFSIATGSTAGTFFPVGEAIAGLISHPAGVARCDSPEACGPAGLIASARTSAGAVDNLIAVNRSDIASGLAQSDVIAAAARGRGPFRRLGPQNHVRVIASLFSENVHLVVAANTKIKTLADLKGKRVSIGSEGSGDAFTAREILNAWGIAEASLKVRHEDVFAAMALMQAGRLDAFFAVGGVPLDPVSELIQSRQARLIPLDGPARARLLKAEPSLATSVIPAGAYGPGTPAVQTISTRAVWIVRDSQPEALVHDITRALFSARNRAALVASHPSAREIALDAAAAALPAPLHPGAARFYARR